MAITVTARTGDPVMQGIDKRLKLTIAMDSSYPAGGESMTPSTYGLSYFDMVCAEPAMGYTFEYDHTNNKLKAFQKAPAVVFEEKHTSASNVVTLDYPAAWIMNVSKASTGMVQNYVGLTTATLSTNEWCLGAAIADGTRTTITLDASATIYVTYATQAWDELYSLLVQSEAITGDSTTAMIPTNTVWGFGYMATESGTVLTPITDADTPATGEVSIDLNTKSGAVAVNAASSAEVYYLTYLKAPTSGTWLADRQVFDEDTVDTAVIFADKPIACWLNCGYGTVSGSATNKMITQDGTVGAGLFKIMWGQTVAAGSATGRTEGQPMYGGGAVSGKLHDMAYVTAFPWEIPTVPLEVKNGTDLSNVSNLNVMIFGR